MRLDGFGFLDQSIMMHRRAEGIGVELCSFGVLRMLFWCGRRLGSFPLREMAIGRIRLLYINRPYDFASAVRESRTGETAPLTS